MKDILLYLKAEQKYQLSLALLKYLCGHV